MSLTHLYYNSIRKESVDYPCELSIKVILLIPCFSFSSVQLNSLTKSSVTKWQLSHDLRHFMTCLYISCPVSMQGRRIRDGR